MTEHEPNGLSEAFVAAATRVALTVGPLVAERVIREREQAQRGPPTF
ncbi:MAG TPA: hypothetical protein VF526_13365 [Solirubrobacteraceae bacterium]